MREPREPTSVYVELAAAFAQTAAIIISRYTQNAAAAVIAPQNSG